MTPVSRSKGQPRCTSTKAVLRGSRSRPADTRAGEASKCRRGSTSTSSHRHRGGRCSCRRGTSCSTRWSPRGRPTRVAPGEIGSVRSALREVAEARGLGVAQRSLWRLASLRLARVKVASGGICRTTIVAGKIRAKQVGVGEGRVGRPPADPRETGWPCEGRRRLKLLRGAVRQLEAGAAPASHRPR